MISYETVMLNLPTTLYQRAKETAEATALSLEEVLTQSIAVSLPPLEEDLDPELRSELLALSLLSDDELWLIAKSMLPDYEQVRFEDLIALQKRDSLSIEDKLELERLMNRAGVIMVRKAEAYRLLSRRGHKVF
jgi:hypothetical protein